MQTNEILFEALTKLNEGNAESSLSELNKLSENEIKEKSLLRDYKLIKGAAYLQLNMLEEAQKEFEGALELDPQSSSACLGLGDIFFRLNLYKEAKTMFEYAIVYEPENKSAAYALSKTNLKLGLSENHNSLLEASQEDENKNFAEKDEERAKKEFEITLSEAYNLYQTKNYYKAYEKAIEIQKFFDEEKIKLSKEDKGSIYNLKGFILLGMENLEAAKTAFEMALHLNPNSSQACAGLGEIFLKQGNFMQAKIMYEWALENNPQNETAKKGLAEANKKLGYDENHNTLNVEAEDLSLDAFYDYVGKAYKDFIDNKFETALKYAIEAEKIIYNINEEHNVQIASLKNFIGFIYLNLRQYEKAQIQFEQALSLNTNSSQACAGLAELFYLLEDYPKAKIMFEYAVKNNPQNKFAKQGLAKTNKKLNFDADHISMS